MTVKWIKIAVDIFDDEKVLLIERMPDCYAIITVWFKLLCLAGKQNNSGVFHIRESMPYTDEMFAAVFRMPVNTVRLALSTFEQFGMVKTINDTRTIPNWGKHQSLDKIEKQNEYQREYMRGYREKQKAIANGEQAKLPSKSNRKPNCNTNVSDADKDIDKERDIETDKEISTEAAPKKRKATAMPPSLDEVQAYCKERKNGINAEQFTDYYTARGWLIGKAAMKDWKAAVRTWERNGNNKQPPALKTIEYIDTDGRWS